MYIWWADLRQTSSWRRRHASVKCGQRAVWKKCVREPPVLKKALSWVGLLATVWPHSGTVNSLPFLTMRHVLCVISNGTWFTPPLKEAYLSSSCNAVNQPNHAWRLKFTSLVLYLWYETNFANKERNFIHHKMYRVYKSGKLEPIWLKTAVNICDILIDKGWHALYIMLIGVHKCLPYCS